MAAALAETPPEQLEEATRWWQDRIEARRIPALRELPTNGELGNLLERVYHRVSAERQWLTGMAGAFPLPLAWSIADAALRSVGLDGDLLDLGHRAVEMMDATFLDLNTPKPKGERDGDHGT